MSQPDIKQLLSRVSGHLQIETEKEKAAFETLQTRLAATLIDEETPLRGRARTYEHSDLFTEKKVSSSRMENIGKLAEKILTRQKDPEYRLFIRETPAVSAQLQGSIPEWAAGAAIDKTVGPFVNADGRDVWFDFYKIEKLVALYIQGKPQPVLLFNVSTLRRFIDFNLPLITDLLPSYRLLAGSIWIHAPLLSTGAPAGTYTGLRIKGGEISLSAAPQLINNQLTITPGTLVNVKLDLDQPDAAASTGDFGADAKALEIELPKHLKFHFTGTQTGIDELTEGKWNAYGDERHFMWQNGATSYDAELKRILIALNTEPETFEVKNCLSGLNTFSGKAAVSTAAWALPVASINTSQPPPAAGTGAFMLTLKPGLLARWKGLQGGEVALNKPVVLCEPGNIYMVDKSTAGSVYNEQRFKLWQDDQNPFGSDVQVSFPQAFSFTYICLSSGVEMIAATANINAHLDRPVTVSGQPLAIRSKNGTFSISASATGVRLGLFDDNILQDNLDPDKIEDLFKPIALALHNAVFTTTPVNGFLLIGTLEPDFIEVKKGFVFLTLGMYAYLPTLPDPYTANLGQLKGQFEYRQIIRDKPGLQYRPVRLWLVCQVKWEPDAQSDVSNVDTSFHFAPLDETQTSIAGGTNVAVSTPLAINMPDRLELMLATNDTNTDAAQQIDPDLKKVVKALGTGRLARVARTSFDLSTVWDRAFQLYNADSFALLDVSSNANQFGVSFAWFGDRRMAMMPTHRVANANAQTQTGTLPIQVQGMDVVSQGVYARAFTVPQISWEPVLNLTVPESVNAGHPEEEPPYGPNYYPNDGGPTRIFTSSQELVPLAPVPLTSFIIDKYANEAGNTVASLFTLPFGMKAIAVLNKETDPVPPKISFNRHHYPNDIVGGIQMRFTAGMLASDRYPLFHGGTMQLNNVLGATGNSTFTGTLGHSVAFIFNNEFAPKMDDLLKSRGVPLTRIDFSGYGSSVFSNWFNPDAQFAQTSQSRFDVFVGRTAHEVIQVRSMIYPWGIRVVRTIILYRVSSGYVYRVDTGWKAESDGLYDFTYRLNTFNDTDQPVTIFPTQTVFETHPGVVNGLFNVENIVETGNDLPLPNTIATGQYYVDANNLVQQNNGGPMPSNAVVKAVEFDCNIEIENVVQGASNGRVACKKMRGFVQLAPMGIPLSATALAALHDSQGGSIGGPVNCVVDIGKNGQLMRVNRVDSNKSTSSNGANPVFAAAARGSVVLPKDGSWTLISHAYSNGDVSPLPESTPVPLIRIGQVKTIVTAPPTADDNGKYTLNIDPAPADQLLRIAHPMELLRNETDGTQNFGFLQNTGTQKMLFLTPAYQKLAVASNTAKLLSKTPPLFADAYRMMSSKALFPNIGNAVTTFGDAIPLKENFAQNALKDAGKQVWELMQINQKDGGGNVLKEGYKLLKQVENFEFPLPDKWFLIDETALKIYVEYKTQKKNGPTKNGGLNFDINSFANDVASNWASKLSNISMVLDLGPFERLMTIKGNFDASKGKEASYKGNESDPDFVAPQIEFSPVLQTVMDILQILQDLQGAKYGDALKKGLKIAMSNTPGSWEYKFEATKEIPVVKFPVPEAVYNAPTTPLKLEAGLKLGVYFNGAIMVTTDLDKLVPTAGAFLEFYGRLSVMCVSLAAATVYAVGEVKLGIAADTKKGPSLSMKFGFGAQIVVGLPVVANVSVLYMVGVEIYADSQTIIVTASLLFQGHADLLGGLVGITITIEAKGSVKRVGDRTDCSAQVTFAIEISIFLVIDIDFSTSWEEDRQIA